MNITIKNSYYVSLCWYCLNQLGLDGKEGNPKYGDWKEKIVAIGEDFGFCAPVAGGVMFKVIYQMTGSINPQCIEELKDVQNTIETFIESGSLESFKNLYPSKTQFWDNWFTHDIKEPKKATELVSLFFQFMELMWNDYKEIYHDKMKQFNIKHYNDIVNSFDIFKRWDKISKVKYPYHEFNLVVCPEIPSYASSIGPEEVVFGLKCGEHEIIPSIIHEIGVRYSNLHYLKENPQTKDIMHNDYIGMLRIIEAEICFRKMKEFLEIDKDRFMNPSWDQIVEWRKKQTFDEINLYQVLLLAYKKAKSEAII